MVAGVTEVLLLLVIVAVFFGAGKIPQFMESMGSGVKSFKEAASEAKAPPKDEPPQA